MGRINWSHFRLPFLGLLLIAVLPYLVGVVYFLAKAPFLEVVNVGITYAREILLLISTSLLIRNGVDLYVAKRNYIEKSNKDSKTIQDVLERTEKIESEFENIAKDVNTIDRNLNKIRTQHIENRVKLKMFEHLFLNKDDNE